MTKKDYELIAGVLSELRIYLQDAKSIGIDPVVRLCDGFADQLEQANPKFNRSKFLQACGLEI